jgi:hypothetical protein
VREEVEGGAAGEPDCGHRVERLAAIAERRPEAEGEEDDAGDHRQVEVAVGVSASRCSSRPFA